MEGQREDLLKKEVIINCFAILYTLWVHLLVRCPPPSSSHMKNALLILLRKRPQITQQIFALDIAWAQMFPLILSSLFMMTQIMGLFSIMASKNSNTRPLPNLSNTYTFPNRDLTFPFLTLGSSSACTFPDIVIEI
jgi:hypothetical protein